MGMKDHIDATIVISTLQMTRKPRSAASTYWQERGLTALPSWGLLARYHPVILRNVAATSTASSEDSAHGARHELVSQMLCRLIQEILLLGSCEALNRDMIVLRAPSKSITASSSRPSSASTPCAVSAATASEIVV